MKRLLRIGFDIFLSSLTPIIMWFLIGTIIDKDLTNVFTLTYPLQCFMGIVISIFGVGANVYSIKDKSPNSVDNGIIYGSLISTICLGLVVFNCKRYISFMNLDTDFYLILGIYSVLQILLQTILHLVLTKLYYLDLNKKANKISFIFNSINFVSFIGIAFITKNQLYASIISLLLLTIFDIIILIKNVNKVDFQLNIVKWIKYDSVNFVKNIMFFIIYLFGFSKSFSFGKEFVIAITFSTLITDIQWDMTTAVRTVAKIDIAKNVFDYRKHLNNSFKYFSLLIASVLLMGLIMYPFYDLNISIVLIFVLLHILDFILCSVSHIKICYLELEHSAVEATTHTLIAYVIRTIISVLPTPFCTILGQIVSGIYEFLYATIAYKKNINIR